MKFRIGKVPVVIHPVFWLVAAMIGWISSMSFEGTLIWIIIIFVSVLIHECGHAFTARLFGQKAHIDLVAFGGLTSRQGRQLKLWKEFLIVFNGPLAGFLLFIVCYFLLQQMRSENVSYLYYLLYIATNVNLFWTIINLLPVFPLDGGHLMRIIFESIFGFKGVKISFFISIILGVLFALYFFIDQNFLAGIIFFMLAYESYRSWQLTMTMTTVDTNSSLQDQLIKAEKELRIGNYDETKKLLEEIRTNSKAGKIFDTATQYLADLYFSEGKYRDVFNLLYPIKDKIQGKALTFLHQSAYHIGEIKKALEMGNKSYQANPNYESALINALSYASMNETDPAVGWLECAIRDGMPNVKQVLLKAEFDSIRSQPAFQRFVNSLS